jgi:hypothetical protein
MTAASRQAGFVSVLSAAAGIAFVVWSTGGSPSPDGENAAPAASELRVGEAGQPATRDPNAPFEPILGQPGKDVVWMPTSAKLVEAMLDLAQVTADDYVIDLGSGDGRTVIAAATRGARALGIEYDPGLVELSERRAAAANVGDRAAFRQADLFETDLSDATVITMFLLQHLNIRLRPTLLGLRPGTRIVSNSFTMGDWLPDDTETVQDDECKNWCTALLWIVPARIGGSWRLPSGTLELRQQFQQVAGTLGGMPIGAGYVRGDTLSFTIGGTIYEARVRGEMMTATDGSWRGKKL